MSVSLRNGVEVEIRPIAAGDKQRLADGYGRLSEETIRRRFLAWKPRLTSADLRYLTEVDGCDHVALVATVGDAIVAVGRWVRLAEAPDTAEFAVVVGDRYQGQRLGTELVSRLASAARARGIRRFTATMLSDNVPAHRLARRLARELPRAHTHHGVDELTVNLAA